MANRLVEVVLCYALLMYQLLEGYSRKGLGLRCCWCYSEWHAFLDAIQAVVVDAWSFPTKWVGESVANELIPWTPPVHGMVFQCLAVMELMQR
ncbi:hypothetical protein U1Q18_002538, partial [Sarracenia purpurea var. burkii]